MAPKGSCEPCAKQRSDTFRRLQGRSKSHQTRTTQIKGATTAEQQPQLEQQQQAAVEAERVSKLNLADVTAKLLDARWTTQQLEIAAATAQSAAAEIKELKGQDQAARRQQQQQQQQQVQCATTVEQQPAAADERQPRLARECTLVQRPQQHMLDDDESSSDSDSSASNDDSGSADYDGLSLQKEWSETVN